MKELELIIHHRGDAAGVDITAEARFIDSDVNISIPGPFRGYLLMPTVLEAQQGYSRYVLETVNKEVLLGYTKIADELLQRIDFYMLPLEIDIPGSFNIE